MDITKPYEFIWFGAMDATKPYELIGFGWVWVALGARRGREYLVGGPWWMDLGIGGDPWRG